MLLFFLLSLFLLAKPAASFLECQNKAYLETNQLVGSNVGSSRFPSTKFTIDVWIRMASSSINTPMGIMAYTLTMPGTAIETTALSLTLQKSTISVTLNSASHDWPLPYVGNNPVDQLQADEWYHLCMVWSSSSGNIRPYINGLVAGDAENLSSETIPNKGRLRLFQSSQTISMGGSGSTMSEFRLWQSELREGEIRKAMQSVAPLMSLPSLDLFVHYRLNNALTASLEDLNGVIDPTSSSDLPHSLRIVPKVGETDSVCDDSESGIDGAVPINNVPRSHQQITYDQAPLIGSGLASDATFNVDAGSEVSIVSFEENNIITRQSTDDSMTLNEQQS